MKNLFTMILKRLPRIGNFRTLRERDQWQITLIGEMHLAVYTQCFNAIATENIAFRWKSTLWNIQ